MSPMLFGISLQRWPHIIAWAAARYGMPRYMSPIRALLWCWMKWMAEGEPDTQEPVTSRHWRLVVGALAGAYV